VNPFVESMRRWTKNMYYTWLLFCCVKTASTQPELTAKNHFVLQQRHTILSGCNAMSIDGLSIVRVCSICEKV
jgi:hypothetical protein